MTASIRIVPVEKGVGALAIPVVRQSALTRPRLGSITGPGNICPVTVRLKG
jgi:hypothetical protein